MLSEVLAGGISMALGGYLAARTAKQILDQRIAIERYEIEHEPDEERAELVAIYQHKGFTGPLLQRVVNHLCGLVSNFSSLSPWERRRRWVWARSCMQDEPDMGLSA